MGNLVVVRGRLCRVCGCVRRHASTFHDACASFGVRGRCTGRWCGVRWSKESRAAWKYRGHACEPAPCSRMHAAVGPCEDGLGGYMLGWGKAAVVGLVGARLMADYASRRTLFASGRSGVQDSDQRGGRSHSVKGGGRGIREGRGGPGGPPAFMARARRQTWRAGHHLFLCNGLLSGV